MITIRDSQTLSDLRSAWSSISVVGNATERDIETGQETIVLYIGRPWVAYVCDAIDVLDAVTGHRWCVPLQLREQALLAAHTRELVLPITEEQRRMLHTETAGEGPGEWAEWLGE